MPDVTWRQRHPFLYGLSQTFGIFQVRQPVETAEQSFQRTIDLLEAAVTEAERRGHGRGSA